MSDTGALPRGGCRDDDVFPWFTKACLLCRLVSGAPGNHSVCQRPRRRWCGRFWVATGDCCRPATGRLPQRLADTLGKFVARTLGYLGARDGQGPGILSHNDSRYGDLQPVHVEDTAAIGG